MKRRLLFAALALVGLGLLAFVGFLYAIGSAVGPQDGWEGRQ